MGHTCKLYLSCTTTEKLKIRLKRISQIVDSVTPVLSTETWMHSIGGPEIVGTLSNEQATIIFIFVMKVKGCPT